MGSLEFAVRDLNYLTAASCLQMEHVVEKCWNALSQFIEPKIGLKEDGVSEASLMSSVSATKSLLPPARTPKPAPKPPPPPPLLPPLLQPVKLEFLLDKDLELKAEGDDDEDEDVSDICNVKVETALEVAHWLKPPGGLAGGLGMGASVSSHLGELAQSSMTPNTVTPPQGVVKSCYSPSEDAEGEGLLLIPGGQASVGATSGLVEAAAVAMAAWRRGGQSGGRGQPGTSAWGLFKWEPIKEHQMHQMP